MLSIVIHPSLSSTEYTIMMIEQLSSHRPTNDITHLLPPNVIIGVNCGVAILNNGIPGKVSSLYIIIQGKRRETERERENRAHLLEHHKKEEKKIELDFKKMVT